nr:hypothetical protein Josef01_10c16_29 [uncultured archaeon]
MLLRVAALYFVARDQQQKSMMEDKKKDGAGRDKCNF